MVAMYYNCSIFDDFFFSDTSFNFTGNTPFVVNDTVIFQLEFGRGVVEAECAIVQGTKVLAQTSCEFNITCCCSIMEQLSE